ncbi:aerotolerance regulator BatA [candidate division KSB1 bacterium 4484_87]|nr:MAG: aerotolerance regulator BatA [candidate division KSB1 bacterium 4484_87]
MFRFANPEFLILLAIIPILIYWYIRRNKLSSATIRFSNLKNLKQISATPTRRYRHILFVLRMGVIALLIVAFARPQSSSKEEKVLTEGIDIVLAMDVSSSMLAEDLDRHKNRLEVAKEVATEFIKGRTNDRIGMVVFSGKSYTQCPLTLDYGILIKFLDEIKIGMIEDGTAIGMALATCVNRLKNSKAKSKVVILLTDGRNNRGEIDPITAAQIAKTFNVRVYTIGAGTRGQAMYPVDDPFLGKRYVPMQVDIDEELLAKIADITGGKYFRATDKKSLEKVYHDIGEMEKTKIEIKEFTRYTEKFVNYVLAALALLLLEIVLANTRFRKIP